MPGARDGTVKRIMGITKAAVNWAWQNGQLKAHVPFRPLPEGQPRERILSIEELARLWSAEMPAHLRMFLLLLMGTAARPQAVLELTRFQCDLERGLIDLNPRGRTQTAKRRPVVPMANFLRPWLVAVPAGPLVAYRGRPVHKIAKTWRSVRKAAGLDESVVPYAIRHTIATELRARGVPELEIAGLLGHHLPNFRTTGRYAKYAPDYLSHSRVALDEIANEVSRTAIQLTSPETHVRATCVLMPKARDLESLVKPGAGEGIRTLDPNLGKVVLYP